MNAGGVPNTCKSSGKVLHLVFDLGKSMQIDTTLMKGSSKAGASESNPGCRIHERRTAE
jgi:hypothetical protein